MKDRTEYRKEYYLNNKEKLLNHQHELGKERTEELDRIKSEKGCAVCGEKEPCVLEFHHIDPTEKEFGIARRKTSNWDKVLVEIEKCEVVCKNCHAKIHAGKLRKVGGVWLNTLVLKTSGP